MSQVQSLPASTILLIEANPSLRRLIMLGLSHSGIHVIETCSVQEIPDLATQTLDLLIIDVDQGVKSDWSLLSTLREQTHLATLPIVALSWDSPAEDNGGASGGRVREAGASPAPTILKGSSASGGVSSCSGWVCPCLPDPISPSLISSTPYPKFAPLGLAPTSCPCPPASLFSSLPFLPSRRGCRDRACPDLLRLPPRNITFLSKPFDARALHDAIAKLLAERAAQKAAQLALVEAQVLASYEQQHAAPSIWPIVTAAGILLIVTGLLFHFLITLVGVVLVLISLLVWTLGTKPVPSVSSSTASTLVGVGLAPTHELANTTI